MTTADWLAAVAQLAPAAVAVAKAWQLHDRVRKLETARDANGPRMGAIEKAVDYTAGRVEEMSKRLNARPTPADGGP